MASYLARNLGLRWCEIGFAQAENPGTEAVQVIQGWQFGIISARQLAEHLSYTHRTAVRDESSGRGAKVPPCSLDRPELPID
jgi:hypothetical protein